MFKRRLPGWLLPVASLAAIFVLWLSLGLWDGAETPSAEDAEPAGASLLAYLSPSNGPAEVFALDLATGQNAQMTTSGGVLAFAVHPSGDRLYLSLSSEGGGSGLWELDLTNGANNLLADCGLALCEALQLSPDGARLAYQRSDPGGAYLPEVWVLDLAEGETQRLSAANHPSLDPQWATAQRLSYYDLDQAAFIITDLEAGEQQSYPNGTGGVHAWPPEGDFFVSAEQSPLTTEILRLPSGEAAFDTPEPGTQQPVQVLSSLLVHYSEEGSQPYLSYEDPLIEDALPVFSPDGQWLAFTRKYLDEARWTPGRQLWLYNLESEESFPLAAAANFQVIAIAWSPDSQQLAYVRASQTEFQAPLELWITNLDGSNAQLIAIDAFAPAWVP